MKKKKEKRILERWVDQRFLHSKWQWKGENQKQAAKERVFKKIEATIQRSEESSFKWNKVLILAASIILICGIALYINRQFTYTTIHSDSSITKVVEPGTESATLTLEDGTVINLDEAKNGILVKSNYGTIKKEEDGTIVYEDGEGSKDQAFINKISVPLGGLFNVILPDGTKVWLNSASILSYPSQFTKDERRVELSGEAYFEVAKNTAAPFILVAGDNEIEVTGTQFNVSAYKNDYYIKTTLIEGGVKVSKNHSELILTPGQQSISNTGSDYFVRKQVNTEIALGWKAGYFVFDDQDIETIMREVARWYDVEITFKKENGKKKVLGGIFSRKKSIDELIEFLEKLNVGKFEKKGRRITIMI